MSISDTTNRVVYAGDGSSTVFSFAHEFFSQLDLKVYLYSSSAIYAQTLNTNYTIGGSFNAQGIYTQGGSVITTCAIPTGTLVVLTRDPSLVQNYTLLQNGNINSVALTQQLDYLTLLCQRLQDKASRTMKLQDGSAQNFDPHIPFALNASSVLITNSTATGWTQGPQADQIFGAQSAAISAANSAGAAATSATSAAANAVLAASAAVSAGNSVSLVGSTGFWGALAQSSALSASNNATLAGSAALSASNSAAIASSSAVSAGNQGAIATSSAVSAGNNAILAASAALSASNSAATISLPLSVANGGTGTGSSFGGIAYLAIPNVYTSSSALMANYIVGAGSSLFSISSTGITNHQQLGVNNATGSSCIFGQTHDINKPTFTLKTLSAQVANVFEILNSSNAPQFVFDSGGNLKFAHNTAAPECRIDLRPGRSTASTNAGSTCVFSMYVGDATLAEAAGAGAGIALGGSQDAIGTATEYGYIWVTKNNGGSGDIGSGMHFATRNNSTAKATRCLEMTSDGHLISFGNHIWSGGTSGGITHVTQSSVTSYNLVWPSAVAVAANAPLTSDTSGNLSWTGVVPTTYGGTGTGTSFIQYGIVFASSATQMANTSQGSAGQVMTSNGAAAPSYQNVTITNSTNIISGTYNATTNDSIILCNSSNYVVNLYGTSGNSGKFINLKKGGKSTQGITIAGSSATIDGSSVVLDFQNESVTLECDGTNWQVRSWYQPQEQVAMATSGPAGWSETRAQCLPYKAGAQWRFRFNFMGTLTSSTSAAVVCSSVVFKNVGAYQQACDAGDNNGAASVFYSRANPNASTVTTVFSGVTTSITVSGDVELETKPGLSI